MSYIVNNLYLGSEYDAYKTKYLKEKLGVTHILTVDIKPLTIEAKEQFVYKYVYALDDEDADLLTYLEECNVYIDEGREAGGVLVHCHAGVSRSGTVVVSYVMWKMDLTLESALELVKSQKPEISPNPGFVQQLKIYESMGNRVDTNSAAYKTYKLERLAKEFRNAQGCIALSDDSVVGDPNVCGASGEIVYKCKKCRRPLFKRSSVMRHSQGLGEQAFHHYRTTDERKEQVTCVQSLFIEPIVWMKSQILSLEGKLTCPKCCTKLGSFNWFGERCPCGQWVIPAFHVANGKVDECKPLVAPSSVSRLKPDHSRADVKPEKT